MKNTTCEKYMYASHEILFACLKKQENCIRKQINYFMKNNVLV